jgi:hypothetical protein
VLGTHLGHADGAITRRNLDRVEPVALLVLVGHLDSVIARRDCDRFQPVAGLVLIGHLDLELAAVLGHRVETIPLLVLRSHVDARDIESRRSLQTVTLNVFRRHRDALLLLRLACRMRPRSARRGMLGGDTSGVRTGAKVVWRLPVLPARRTTTRAAENIAVAVNIARLPLALPSALLTQHSVV